MDTGKSESPSSGGHSGKNNVGINFAFIPAARWRLGLNRIYGHWSHFQLNYQEFLVPLFDGLSGMSRYRVALFMSLRPSTGHISSLPAFGLVSTLKNVTYNIKHLLWNTSIFLFSFFRTQSHKKSSINFYSTLELTYR